MFVLVYIIAIISSIYPLLVDSCYSSGVCEYGSGVNCGYQQQPPQPFVCQPACSLGYHCGQYGCYPAVKKRAKASNTLQIETTSNSSKSINNIEKVRLDFGNCIYQVALQSPDGLFTQCCEDRKLPSACVNRCTFQMFNKEALQAIFFRMDECKTETIAEIQYCAAQGRDHSECCRRNGVTTTIAGDKCLVFCDQRLGQIKQLDFSYLPCYERFDNIKSCFWHNIYADA